MSHPFPKVRDPKFSDEMQTLVCPRCGTRMVVDCRTKRTVPANLLELAPQLADCDLMAVGNVMES